MPFVKSHEALPERPVIILLYGEPGASKTSIFNTCANPILVDGDKGVHRSIMRKDTLQVASWNEVLEHEAAGLFNQYSTIGLDTPKALLDDYLATWVVQQDVKLRTNKLGMYGAMGDNFKMFINNRRDQSADIFIVCHAKRDEETKRVIPDVTGQSYQLLMRIADQVGYLSIKNGKRTISFEPTDTTVGKNVAGLGDVLVPDKSDPAFKTFGADLIANVKKAISEMDDVQREALEKSESFQQQIADCTDIDELGMIVPMIEELPSYLQVQLIQVVGDKYSEFIDAAENPKVLTDYTGIVNTLPDGLKKGLRLKVASKAKDANWEWQVDAFITKDKSTDAPAAANRGAVPKPTPPAKSAPKKVAKEEKPKVRLAEWFSERVGQTIYAECANAYTGNMVIEDADHAAYLFNVAQKEEGYMFAEARKEEVAHA